MPLQQRKRKAAPSKPQEQEYATGASEDAYNLIKRFEGLELEAYPDPGSEDGLPWTIGYGHTKGVRKGMVITKEEAENLLRNDVRIFEAGVKMLIKVPLTQGQMDSLISFTYNAGLGSLQRSTMRQKINRGEHGLVPAEFMKWVWAGKTKLPGLIRRRAAEAELYAGQTIDEA